ncbi:Gfo/Idh/MocA family protein [Nocardioides daeguensis]|uniref:Gfo/Idh/MocA family oxidoreductase n=1 Tax=Nocardioides daeguensis TaxID=908359 RepID=A0ABP6W8D2_9ACTN|nr:Gfo/Idh/MocA family oxidoreductase [Nocardioides daeguensis]MBV6727814.1 Gfo/Idh/MocA family oxidoreductase [Nocardioides daeguensis]MCR1775285.1 Gfo/Idh/MocA family oxidoreductase [Nocardioides daeguensis]
MTGTAETIGWGILATGKIARSFAADLALVPGARLAAVGSRNEESARAFAAAYGDGRTRAHGSYAALMADPTVDVVYVATPHALHLDGARAAFASGKHVLCEKPLTLRTADGEAMVRLAVEHDRFLMEAMWTACHPVVRELRRELATGRFGTPRHLAAELGFRVDVPPSDRMLAPELGGGALLDMGIYPLTLAHLLLGEAEELRGVATLADSGVDLDIAIAGRYPRGAMASLHASMTSWSSRAASIATDLGRVELHGDFHHPRAAVFTPAGRPEQAVVLTGEEPVVGRGYGNEIAEVGRCLRAGLRESPLVPHAQTLTVLRQMDALRADLEIRYPDDPAD